MAFGEQRIIRRTITSAQIQTWEGREILYWIGTLNWDEVLEWIGEWGVSRGATMCVTYAALLALLGTYFVPHPVSFIFYWLVATSPLWMPFTLAVTAYKVWIWYAHAAYISKQKTILLEMKIPRDIMKSPRAMETVLSELHSIAGETTFINRQWSGQVRPWHSLEITSFGGEIHFYVWTFERYRTTIESQFYAQYPEIELIEVEDYASKFRFDPKKHRCYNNDYRFEPIRKNVDAYTIRTYVEFELDQDPKEEFKIDPLAQILEWLNTVVKPTEQVWIQILFRSHYREYRRKLNPKTNKIYLFQYEPRWKAEVEEEVEKIRVAGSTLNAPAPTGEERRPFPRPTWKHQRQMETMERNLGKLPYDFGVRGAYISTPKDFNSPGYTGLRWVWRPFWNPQYMNFLRPRRWQNPFDYPWQDFHGYRWNLHTYRFFDAYRRRSYFHPPYITPYNVTTQETLATIFHPPSRGTQLPGLTRMPSTKAAPPANLPK